MAKAPRFMVMIEMAGGSDEPFTWTERKTGSGKFKRVPLTHKTQEAAQAEIDEFLAGWKASTGSTDGYSDHLYIVQVV